MRLFYCGHCEAPVFFDNLTCLTCGSALAYHPGKRMMIARSSTLTQWADHQGVGGAGVDTLPLCANRDSAALCNWLVDKDGDSALCRACQLTSVYPAQDSESGRRAWSLSERAKRRWLYTVLQMGLTALPQTAENPAGVTFRILEPGSDKSSVLTGHADGVITINAIESDPVERLTRRTALEEPYRTLLGHLRHESGHYYWQLLVDSDAERLDGWRAIFGDERTDYAKALEEHYQGPPSSDWSQAYISHYAASHPWEDFAETWAHYMHIIDALDLAQSWGLKLPHYPERQIEKFASQAEEISGFRPILRRWLPISLFGNSLNRSLGHEDLYPFAPSTQVIKKMAWIHHLVARVSLN